MCHALHYLILHPVLWNLDVKAGSLATTVDPDDKSFTVEMIEKWINWQEERSIKVSTELFLFNMREM